MKDIQDLLDELENAAYKQDENQINKVRSEIDKWLEENEKKLKQFDDLKKIIKKYFGM